MNIRNFFQVIFVISMLNFLIFQHANSQTAQITIDLQSLTDAGLTLPVNNYNSGAERLWTQNTIQFGAKAICAGSSTNAGTIQAQASNGVIYNITPFPGRVVSVTYTQRGTLRESTLYGTTTGRLVDDVAANYSVSGGDEIGAASTTGWDSNTLSATNATYIALKRGANASYFDFIEIVYETSASESPYLNITQPIDGAIVYNSNINVDYTTDMTVSVSDYHVQYKVNGDAFAISNDNPIAVSLYDGENIIVLELVDNTNASLDPIVTDTVIVNKEPLPDPTITITSPIDGATLSTENINVQFTAEYVTLGTDAFVRCYHNGIVGSVLSTNPIPLTLVSGNNTIVVELLDQNENAYSPMISDTINVTYEAPFVYTTENTMYTLVTDNSQVVDGGKYLLVGIKNGQYYAMSYQKFNTTGTSQTNRSAFAVELFAQDSIAGQPAETINDTVPYEFTLEATANGFAIKDNVNDDYLQFPGGGNYLTLSDLPTDWTININNNIAEIVWFADITRSLQFNVSASPVLFNCYTSVQTPVYLFKATPTDTLISISKPANDSVVTTDFMLKFKTFKFTLSNPSGDGHAHLYINGNLQSGLDIIEDSVLIELSSLNFGTNTISLELVHNDESSLVPPVTNSVSVIYNDPSIVIPEITIVSPTENEIISTIDATVVYDTLNTEQNSVVKYILDSDVEIIVTDPTTITLTSPLADGNHTVVVNLYDATDVLLATDTVNFVAQTPVLPEVKLYQLVTSQDDIIAGEKYLIVGKELDNYLAMGVQKTSNRWGVSIQPENDYIYVSPAIEVIGNDTVNPYEIQLVEREGAFAIFDPVNQKFLITRSSGTTGNHLKLSDTDTLSWNITIEENYQINAECNDTVAQSFLRFNDNNYLSNPLNNPLFSAYSETSTMEKVYFYRYITDTVITITSPEENEQFTTTNNVDVNFNVYNFTLNADGIVKYTVDGIVDYTTSNTIQLENLNIGQHSVELELVAMDSTTLNQVISANVSFSIVPGIEITSTDVQASDISIFYQVTNCDLGNNAYVKLTLNDEEFDTDITENPITVIDLEIGNYTAIVELVDVNFNSLSPIISDTTTFIVMSLKDFGSDNINIYPNPSTDYIIINCEDNIIDNLSIYNNLGQLLIERKNLTKENKINISSLKSGEYTVCILSNGKIKTQNLIVK